MAAKGPQEMGHGQKAMATEMKKERRRSPRENSNPVKITDVTLRDGHQSTLATRMRTEDVIPIAEEMDKARFHSMEVWGGATFDVATRFLNEDPWERVRVLKRLMPHTPLQMLLRGQNLVGYRNYPDDVVRAFVHHAAECGIDVFRVFDAVNDERNMEASFAAIKECGKHIQATICYSITEAHLGGPVYNLDYFMKKATTLEKMGADSLCIKDMAGLLAPYDAYELVTNLKAKLKIPVQLHTHHTSGMASMSCLKAIEAGIDAIDTALAPFALRSSHPAVESLVAALQQTPRDPQLDINLLFKLGDYIESIAPKYRDFLDSTRMSVIDTQVLSHQIPGGMTTNLVSQLREADALDRLEEVYEELEIVRRDLGSPPLVTPTSQIVGSQAVQNVIFGRYKMITSQVKDYIFGLYGRPPVPIEPRLIKLALKNYERGQKPITCRAADLLEPELDKAKEATKDIARDIGDVLIYTLFPVSGMRFLRWKYGLEEPPPEVKPKTLEDVAKEDEIIEKAKKGLLKEVREARLKGLKARSFNVYVGDEYFKVEVEPADAKGPVSGGATAALAHQSIKAPAASPAPQKAAPATATPAVTEGETALVAPLPGIVLRYEVEVGQQVKAGDVVVILETMKMENSLPSPVDGAVKSLNVSPGTKVAKGDILAIIG